MALYIAIPKSGQTVVEVATGTALKTLLQVATPSTTDIRVVAWGVSFDAAAAAAAGICTLIDTNVAATVTSQTPEKWGSDDSPSSLCIGGTSATGYNASAEGTITGSRVLDSQNIEPQLGYSVWFPKSPKIKASRFLRIRTSFAASVNGIPWIIWEEPA